jgi:putative membrane protein
MRIFILLAKIAVAFIWIVLLTNIFYPFPGKSAIALYVMTGFLFMMHAVQMLIFLGAFGDKIKMSRWEKLSILIFGVFQLLDIRRKHMM